MSLRLMVLGLLNESPKHGYDIQKWLEQSRTDTWANVLSGSIYYALQKMEQEGFVQVQETTQTGHRLKSVYAITETGLAEFTRLLRDALEQPPRSFPAEFYTALAFLHKLPREEARVAVEALIPRLQEELDAWARGEEAKSQVDMAGPEFVRAVFQNGREHLEADLRLLHHLKALLSQDAPDAP